MLSIKGFLSFFLIVGWLTTLAITLSQFDPIKPTSWIWVFFSMMGLGTIIYYGYNEYGKHKGSTQIYFTLGIVSIVFLSLSLVFIPFDWTGAWEPVCRYGFSSTNIFLLLLCFLLIFQSIRNASLFTRWEIIAGSCYLYVASGLAFAAAYKSIPDSLSNVTCDFDYIYFSFVSLSTTGYGDITPKGHAAKLLSIIEPFVGGYLILGVFISGALGLVNDPTNTKELVTGTNSDRNSQTSVGGKPN